MASSLTGYTNKFIVCSIKSTLGLGLMLFFLPLIPFLFFKMGIWFEWVGDIAT